MERLAGSEGQAKWPEAGIPPAAWFEAMDRVEERLNAYARAHGMGGIASPEPATRAFFENVVATHAHLRVLSADKPSTAEWRTAARQLRLLARSALELGVVPLEIPSGADERLYTLLSCVVAEDTAARARGGGSLERADLVLLAERVGPLARRFRDRQGRKENGALRELRRSVSEFIEMCWGPGSAKCYDDWLAGDPGGLLYEVVAAMQPWLRGLEELTPNALRLALQRVGPRPRAPRGHER